eukprot:scaffold2277_cov137-Cylindrotheca_fusiformis.AAC.9
MSVLHYFMRDLLMNYEGEIQIVVDNARMTRNQKAAHLPLMRDSLHSSNHSTTRWEMNDSSHSTGPGASGISASSLCSVPTAPIRKPSKDLPSPVGTRSSLGSKSKPGKKEKHRDGKHRKSPSSPSSSRKANRSPPSPSFTKKTVAPLKPVPSPSSSCSSSSSSRSNKHGESTSHKTSSKRSTDRSKLVDNKSSSSSSLMLIKPSRQLSPIHKCDSGVSSLKTYLKRQGRSLSKTLGVADVPPQAPKIPMRKPSNQPDVLSPVPPPPSSNNTTTLSSYKRRESSSDESLSSTERSNSSTSLRADGSMAANADGGGVLEPPLYAGYRRRNFPKPSGKWLRPLSTLSKRS